MSRLLSALILSLLLALSSAAWARPEKWKKTTTYLVKDDVLDDALARAKAKALADYEAMERARSLAGARAGAEYRAMEEARAKAATPH